LASTCHIGIFTPEPGGTVTINEASPLTPLSEAETVVEPEATALASPELSIVATAVFAIVQVAVVVMAPVVPSLYVAVAVNCCVVPMAKLAAPGETATEVIVFPAFAVTFSMVVPFLPLIEAPTVVEPAAMPVARPLELIVAIAEFAAVQFAEEVTFAVEPSLYVAVAVNCSVAPAAMLAFPGDTAIDVRVFVDESEFPELPQPVVASTSRKEKQSELDKRKGARRIS
jgi:hypothetical protein